MKRIIGILAAVIMTIGLVTSASANIISNPGNYFGTFDGQEAVYDINGYRVLDPQQLLNPEGGFSMGAAVIVNTIRPTDGANPNSHPSYPSLYSGEGGGEGIYLAVMNDFLASKVVQTGSGNGSSHLTANIYFTGGTIAWYFIPEKEFQDYANIRYTDADGFIFHNNNGGDTLANLLTDREAFIVAELTEKYMEEGDGVYTGMASVKYNLGNGYLEADFESTGQVLNDPMYDTNAYAGADFTFGAKVAWNNNSGIFLVDDGRFRISTVAAPTPEPGTFILMGLGLLGAVFFVRRQQKARM